MSSVEVSVIIACRNAARTIRACLDSLARQRTGRSFEVIVADSSTDGTDDIIRSEYPAVRLLHFKTRKYPGDARNAAIAESRGEIFAFLDSDCTAAPDWVEQMALAQQDCETTAGGVIDNGSRSSLLHWAAYFCEFSQWMPPGRPCWMDEIPTCNLSIRRDVFHRYGPFLEGIYCSDTDLHLRLRQDGHRARFVPAVRIWHHSLDHWRHFLSHEHFHGRSFAALRVRKQCFSASRRLLYACCAPALPMLLYARILARTVRSRRYLAPLFLCSPVLALGLASWSLGEMRAYLHPERRP